MSGRNDYSKGRVAVFQGGSGPAQPELLPTPGKDQLWSPGDGTVCKVVTAWRRSRKNAGVVVRWQRGVEGRRALWNYAEFTAKFAPVQPDILERSRIAH